MLSNNFGYAGGNDYYEREQLLAVDALTANGVCARRKHHSFGVELFDPIGNAAVCVKHVQSCSLADDLDLHWLGGESLDEVGHVADHHSVSDGAGLVNFDNDSVIRRQCAAAADQRQGYENVHEFHALSLRYLSYTRNMVALITMTLLISSAPPAVMPKHHSTHSSKSHHRSRRPKWMDSKIAGREGGYMGAIYDPSRNWYLVNGGECDGAIGFFYLTQDRRRLERAGFSVYPPARSETGESETDIYFRRLPNLATGHGVAIGQTPSQVWKRLGPPTRIKKTGYRKQFLEYRYTWKEGKRLQDRQYDQTYVFKKGKLIEINFDSVSNSV